MDNTALEHSRASELEEANPLDQASQYQFADRLRDFADTVASSTADAEQERQRLMTIIEGVCHIRRLVLSTIQRIKTDADESKDEIAELTAVAQINLSGKDAEFAQTLSDFHNMAVAVPIETWEREKQELCNLLDKENLQRLFPLLEEDPLAAAEALRQELDTKNIKDQMMRLLDLSGISMSEVLDKQLAELIDVDTRQRNVSYELGEILNGEDPKKTQERTKALLLLGPVEEKILELEEKSKIIDELLAAINEGSYLETTSEFANLPLFQEDVKKYLQRILAERNEFLQLLELFLPKVDPADSSTEIVSQKAKLLNEICDLADAAFIQLWGAIRKGKFPEDHVNAMVRLLSHETRALMYDLEGRKFFTSDGADLVDRVRNLQNASALEISQLTEKGKINAEHPLADAMREFYLMDTSEKIETTAEGASVPLASLDRDQLEKLAATDSEALQYLVPVYQEYGPVVMNFSDYTEENTGRQRLASNCAGILLSSETEEALDELLENEKMLKDDRISTFCREFINMQLAVVEGVRDVADSEIFADVDVKRLTELEESLAGKLSLLPQIITNTVTAVSYNDPDGLEEESFPVLTVSASSLEIVTQGISKNKARRARRPSSTVPQEEAIQRMCRVESLKIQGLSEPAAFLLDRLTEGRLIKLPASKGTARSRGEAIRSQVAQQLQKPAKPDAIKLWQEIKDFLDKSTKRKRHK
ncbi:hypothetical protein HZA38_02150 [Candidatus Peregrinibacteria bacterium]|nr:hypothetical protein [Candidatus Peregrinibacteria bacterium]